MNEQMNNSNDVKNDYKVAGCNNYEPSLAELIASSGASKEPATQDVYLPTLGPNGTYAKIRQLSANEVMNISFKKLETKNGKVVSNPAKEAHWEAAYMIHYATVYPKISLSEADALLTNPRMTGVSARLYQAIIQFNNDPVLNTIEQEANFLLSNQLLTLSLIVAHKSGKLIEFLGGDEKVVEVITQNLPRLVALYRVNDFARETGITLPLEIEAGQSFDPNNI